MRLTEFLDADEQAAKRRVRFPKISAASLGKLCHPRRRKPVRPTRPGRRLGRHIRLRQGLHQTRPATDSKTLVAYKRPGGESDHPVKILKDNPHVAVVHSDMPAAYPPAAGKNSPKPESARSGTTTATNEPPQQPCSKAPPTTCRHTYKTLYASQPITGNTESHQRTACPATTTTTVGGDGSILTSS